MYPLWTELSRAQSMKLARGFIKADRGNTDCYYLYHASTNSHFGYLSSTEFRPAFGWYHTTFTLNCLNTMLSVLDIPGQFVLLKHYIYFRFPLYGQVYTFPVIKGFKFEYSLAQGWQPVNNPDAPAYTEFAHATLLVEHKYKAWRKLLSDQAQAQLLAELIRPRDNGYHPEGTSIIVRRPWQSRHYTGKESPMFPLPFTEQEADNLLHELGIVPPPNGSRTLDRIFYAYTDYHFFTVEHTHRICSDITNPKTSVFYMRQILKWFWKYYKPLLIEAQVRQTQQGVPHHA